MFARRALLSLVLFTSFSPMQSANGGMIDHAKKAIQETFYKIPYADKLAAIYYQVKPADITKITQDLMSHFGANKHQLYQPHLLIPIAEQLFAEHSSKVISHFDAFRDVVLHPAITESFIAQQAQKTLGSDGVAQIYQQLQTESLLDLLCAGKPTTPFEFFKLMIAYKREKNLTATEAHFMRYMHKNSDMIKFCTNLKNNLQFKSFVQQLVAQEKKIIAAGNLSFVHSAKQNIIFCMDMYTQAWYIKNGLPARNDYLFMRFENLTRHPLIQKLKKIIWLVLRKKMLQEKITVNDCFFYCKQPTQKILEAIAKKIDDAQALAEQKNIVSEKRKELITQLITGSSAHRLEKVSHELKIDKDITQEKIRKRLVFLNGAFFANSILYGDCTAHYFWNNNNCSTHSLNITSMMKKLGLESYYTTYQNEFQELAALHEKIAAGKGAVIQFECTPEAARQSIYAAGICGPIEGGPRNLYIGNRIDDVKDISDMMRTNVMNIQDADIFQYCYIAAAQEPGKGISMHRHYYGDQNLVQEYYQKRDALFSKIRAQVQTSA